MRIGITGATGYIGRHAAQALTKAGHEVIGFSRSPDKTPPPEFSGLRKLVTEADGKESTDFSGLDGVLHLAGEPIFGLWSGSKEIKVWSSRVDLTRNLRLQMAKLPEDQRPKVLVSASGINYYGDRGDDWVTETDGFPDGKLFPELVDAWESEALAFQELGLRVVCGRIGVVIGDGSPACSLLKKIFGAGLGGQIGNGKQWMSWVHVDDLCQMFVDSFGKDSFQGPINFCAPEPARNSELTKLLGKTLHRPTLLPVPPFGLKMVFGPMSAALLDSVRAKPAILQKQGFDFQYAELGPALEQTFSDKK